MPGWRAAQGGRARPDAHLKQADGLGQPIELDVGLAKLAVGRGVAGVAARRLLEMDGGLRIEAPVEVNRP